MIAARLTVVLLFLIGPYFISIGNCQTDTLSDSSAIPLKKFHSLKIQLGVGPQFHLTSTTNDDPNIPNQFENPTEEPSISTFFGNGLNIKGALSYSLAIENRPHFFIGLEYARSTISNDEQGSEVVLGEQLKITSVTPYVGAGNYIDRENSTFVYAFLGVPFRNYEGSYEGVGEFAGFDFKQSYEQSTFLRIGGGLELRRFGNSGFEVGIGGHVDFGSVDRGEIEISQNGTVVDTGTPEGVLNLADPQLELFVTMGYRLQL